jgi:hypothetical protein
MKRFLTLLLMGSIFLSYALIYAKENDRKILTHAQNKERKILNTPLKGEQANSLNSLSPLVRIEPDSLSYTLPRFIWSTTDFYIHNDGDQALTVSITDVETTILLPSSVAPKKTLTGSSVPAIKQQLRKIRIPREISTPQPLPFSPSSPGAEAVVITDPAGDVSNPGIDVVSVDISENVFSYIFKVNFAAAPDSSALPILSLDLDQNFATGSFPSPLGFGPGFFDVGAEYDIIFDVGNFLGDSLGLPPSAYAIVGGDTSFTPAGVALLNIGTNSVEAQFLKLLSPPLLDDNLNAALVSLSLVGLELPDFAPDYGHGLLGQENGLSWLAELDSSGFSSIPLQGTVAPGDSLQVQAKLVTVNPEGNYSAEIHIANNSANNPNVVVPVTVSIMGLSNPTIMVSPLQIADTLAENQPPKQYNLTLTNTGVGNLLYLVTDSLPPGEDWLNVPGLGVGQLGGGESDLVPVEVNPAGLAPDQTYIGYVMITSNDASNPRIEVPVEIHIQGSAGIANQGTLPKDFALHPNYPNPFNAVTLEIFNILGQRVKTLLQQLLPAGQYTAHWNGTNTAAEPLGNGIYLYRLTAGKRVFTRKMILMK